MVLKHYIIAEHEPVAKRYVRERSNLGMIPLTVKSFLNEMYYHPLFAFESRTLSDVDSFSQDVLMASIGQILSKGNYFKAALEIKGNRRLLLNSLLELKLAGINDSNIKKLKLENTPKAKSLVELYTLFLAESRNEFNYPDMVMELQVRIDEGKYDKILSSINVSFLTEVIIQGAEVTLIELIKSKTNLEELNGTTSFESTGTLLNFQNFLSSKQKSPEATFDETISCQSAITKEAMIYKVFSWMKGVGGSNNDTDIVLLNYDDLAPELYRISQNQNYPIFLTRGLQCKNFSFYAQIMTVLAGFAHLENAEYIEKAQSYLMHMTRELKEDTFRKKALSVLSDIRAALKRYDEIGVHLDVHHLLLRELKNTRLSSKELELDESGLWISEVPDIEGLKLKNVAILGLENSNYPKKKKIDPVLKSDEREQIKNSVDVNLSLEKIDLLDQKVERLCGNIKGNLFLGYNSHDLTSGKLTVPSSFYNNVLSFMSVDITIENIYKLCSVSQSFLEDIDYKNEFYPLNNNSTLGVRLDERKKELLSREINSFDFGHHEEIKLELSASSLETFYACPHKFHLSYHLKLKPKDLDRGDTLSWLDDSMRGTFIHKLYENLLLPFKGNTDYSSYLSCIDESKIRDTFAFVVSLDEFREHNLDVADYIREAETEEIIENALQFISFEKEYATSAFYPIYLEHKFNFEIELNGEPLKFSGTIDRIDTDGKENFRVIDYKTGKDYFAKNQTNLFATLDHKKPKPYFQHAIYSIAVSDYLASEKIKYSTIEAGYYFSSDKGKWRRVLHTANDSTKEFKTYLELYHSEAKNKQYFKNAESCTFCEYKGICKGEQKERTKKVSFDQIERIKNLLMKDLKNA